MLTVATQPSAPHPSTSRLSDRTRFWLGFGASFLLLTLLSLGGLFVASGLNRIDLASLQTTAWQPPPTAPTPLVTESTSDQPAVTDDIDALFAIGDRVRNVTSTRVNIRNVPGYLSKPAGDIIAQTLPGEAMEIIGGRTLADNLIWWRIRYATGDGRAIDGWIAEATASGVQILAAAP